MRELLATAGSLDGAELRRDERGNQLVPQLGWVPNWVPSADIT